MGDDVVGKIFQRGPIAKFYHGFEHRRLLRSSINTRRRRRRQADVRAGFLNDLRDKMIASQHSAGRIEKHQVGGSVVHLKRCERLQRQSESRLRQDGAPAAPLELQPQVAVAPDTLRIQTGGSGGSIR